MGWGVIALDGTRLSHIEHGVIATSPPLGLGLRLMALHRELSRGDRAACARRHRGGAGLCRQGSLGRAQAGPCPRHGAAGGGAGGLEIAEYSPNHIKKCVVGAGHAGKEQVQFMVRRLLPACGVDQADAADALAAAIAHAHLSGTRAPACMAAMRMIGKLTGIVDSIAEDP